MTLSAPGVAAGDDFALLFNEIQTKNGIGGAAYWSAPTDDETTLAALPIFDARYGEIVNIRVYFKVGGEVAGDGFNTTPGV